MTKLSCLKKVEIKTGHDGEQYSSYDKDLQATIYESAAYENSKSYILDNPINVSKGELVILAERLRWYKESQGDELNDNNQLKIAEAEQHKSSGEGKLNSTKGMSLVKECCRRIYNQLVGRGSKGTFREVLEKLNDEAGKDGEVGRLVKSANGEDGIVLVGRDDPVRIGTVKNWLTKARKVPPPN